MGYNIEIYDSITVEPSLPADFVLTATKLIREQSVLTPAILSRWPALERLGPDVPFDISHYRTQEGEVLTYIECQPDNQRPYDFEDHLETLRQVIVESFPGVTFSGSMHWRGEESPDEGWIAIEADGGAVVFITGPQLLGVPLAEAEEVRASLGNAGGGFTAWFDRLLAVSRAQAGLSAPSPPQRRSSSSHPISAPLDRWRAMLVGVKRWCDRTPRTGT